jgi:hypothetical protein
MGPYQKAKSREYELDRNGSGLLPVTRFDLSDAWQLAFFYKFQTCLLLTRRVRKIAKTDY